MRAELARSLHRPIREIWYRAALPGLLAVVLSGLVYAPAAAQAPVEAAKAGMPSGLAGERMRMVMAEREGKT